MILPKQERADRAKLASLAARYRRVHYRDNREPGNTRNGARP